MGDKFMFWSLNDEVKCVALSVATHFDVIDVSVDTMHCLGLRFNLFARALSWAEKRKALTNKRWNLIFHNICFRMSLRHTISIINFWINFWIYGLKLNIPAHIYWFNIIEPHPIPLRIFTLLRPKTPVYEVIGLCTAEPAVRIENKQRGECVLTPSPLPPPNIQSTHPVHHHQSEEKSSSFRNIVSEWEQSQDAFSRLNLPCCTIRTGLSRLSNIKLSPPFQTHYCFMKLYIYIFCKHQLMKQMLLESPDF